MNNGCTNKPTPRSETDRLKSNVFKGPGNDGVFLIAWIMTMFSTMAVELDTPLKTQLAMYDEYTPASVMACRTCRKYLTLYPQFVKYL